MRKSSFAVAVVVVALLAAAAVAAVKPSGTYRGSVTFKDASHRTLSFSLQATFSKASRLTRLEGQGSAVPYNPRKSHGPACGEAQSYDSADQVDKGKFKARITGSTKADGSFSYVLKDRFGTTAYLRGKVAKAQFRIKSKVKSAKSSCDSGYLRTTLRK